MRRWLSIGKGHGSCEVLITRFVPAAIAWTYASLAIASVCLAACIDWFMRNSKLEHLLPDVLVMALGLPLSLLAFLLLSVLPDSITNAGWFQLPLLYLCPLMQAGALLWLLLSRRKA